MHKKEVGKRLEALRHAKGVKSQGEFAETLGVETGTYNHWTTGQRLIPVPVAIRLCQISGATLDYIYRGDVSGLPNRLTTLLPSTDEAGVPGKRSA